MKKIIAIGLAGLLTSGIANAEQLTSGPNTITMLDCTQLANDIKIVLSGNVVGGIDCSTDSTIIGVSVCHTTGLTTSRSVSTTPDTDAGGNKTCSGGLSLNDDGTACIGVITGAGFPSATTAQGTVISRFPGVNCSASAAETEATAAVTQAAGS